VTSNSYEHERRLFVWSGVAVGTYLLLVGQNEPLAKDSGQHFGFGAAPSGLRCLFYVLVVAIMLATTAATLAPRTNRNYLVAGGISLILGSLVLTNGLAQSVDRNAVHLSAGTWFTIAGLATFALALVVLVIKYDVDAESADAQESTDAAPLPVDVDAPPAS